MTTQKVKLTFPTQAKETIADALVSMKESMIEENPLLAYQLDDMDEALENMDMIINMTIEVMSKHLTQEEIQFLNDLYTNPVLLSIMAKYPAMMKDAVKLGSELASQDFIEQNF